MSGLGNGGPDDNDAQAGRLIAVNLRGREEGARPELDDAASYIAAALTKGSATGEGVSAPGRRQEDDVNLVAFHPTGGGAKGLSESDDVAPGTGTGGTVAISSCAGVRRLTPVECERLQALPDNWTMLDESTADSRRYSALGDAVTASVAQWIAERLNAA